MFLKFFSFDFLTKSLFQDVVNRLKVFQRYSRQVRQKLSGLLFYESYETGRRIIQQGHQAKSFYFLLSGSCMVKSDEKDKKTGVCILEYLRSTIAKEGTL